MTQGGIKKPKNKKATPAKKVNLQVKVTKQTRKRKSKAKAPNLAETSKKPVKKKVRKRVSKPIVKKEPIKDQPLVEARILTEKQEKDKRLIMWAGVTFFMVLVVVGWLYNMKMVIKESRLQSESDFSIANWNELSDELNNRIEQIKEDITDIESFAGQSTELSTSTLDEIKVKLEAVATNTSAQASPVATSTNAADENQAEIELLKQKLKELESDLKN